MMNGTVVQNMRSEYKDYRINIYIKKECIFLVFVYIMSSVEFEKTDVDCCVPNYTSQEILVFTFKFIFILFPDHCK